MKRHYYHQVSFLVLIGMLVLSAATVYGAEESIVLTTYYPSPYGVYGEMRLYPKASATCNNQQEGLMYYDNNAGKHVLRVCGGSPLGWQDIGGGFWAASPFNSNDIYNTNLGNVGIGTTNPLATLDIYHIKDPVTMGHVWFGGDNPVYSDMSFDGGSDGIFVFTNTGRASGGTAFYSSTTGQVPLVMTNTGNVGIGTTNPNFGRLHVDGHASTTISGANLPRAFAVGGGGQPLNMSLYVRNQANDGIAHWHGELAVAGISDNGVGVYGEGHVAIGGRSEELAGNFEGNVVILPYRPGVGGNVGIGTANPNPSAPNGAPGNLDVNDIYLRSTGRWVSRSPFLQSANGSYTLYMQDDGNLVIYGPGGAIFDTGTWGGKYGIPNLRSGSGRYYLAMQDDGNLVIYDTWAGFSPKWWSQNTLSCSNSCWSDVSLKENIATLDGALAKIQQLRGVSFHWKDKQRGEGPQIGLIAQEVEKVFPEVVGSMSGLKSVEYGRLVAPLIEALKEQQAQIEAQGKLIKQLQDEFKAVNAKSASK